MFFKKIRFAAGSAEEVIRGGRPAGPSPTPEAVVHDASCFHHPAPPANAWLDRFFSAVLQLLPLRRTGRGQAGGTSSVVRCARGREKIAQGGNSPLQEDWMESRARFHGTAVPVSRRDRGVAYEKRCWWTSSQQRTTMPAPRERPVRYEPTIAMVPGMRGPCVRLTIEPVDPELS